MFQKDENGLYILSAGDGPWGEALDENFRTIGAQLANKANREQPTIYDLKLCAGFQNRDKGRSVYYKMVGDIVVIHYSVQTDDSKNSIYDTHIATLPEGFRPREPIAISGAGYELNTPKGSMGRVACIGYLLEDGTLSVHSYPSYVGAVHGHFSFPV